MTMSFNFLSKADRSSPAPRYSDRLWLLNVRLLKFRRSSTIRVLAAYE